MIMRIRSKTFAVIGAAFLLHTVSCQIPLNPDGGQHTCGQCPHERTSEPLICATDGRTYTKCELRQAQCLGHRVQRSENGDCSTEKRCFAQQTQARLQKDVFVPACTPDGKFEPLQCYPSGHCWCVNAIGKVVPALTTGANKRPNCKRNACSSDEREYFNGILLAKFATEAHLAQGHNGSYAAAARWKFRQLDRDDSQTLDIREYRDLKRLVKRLVEPRACARNFIKFSDRDNNNVITEREWMVSLGVHEPRTSEDDAESMGTISLPNPDELEETSDQAEDNGSDGHPTDDPPLEEDECLAARDTALERHRDGATYVPVCNADGSYRDMQCHSGVCWCVAPKTGKPIQGTAHKGNFVDCAAAKNKARNLKGCPVKRKKTFAKYLVSAFHIDRNKHINMTLDQAMNATAVPSVRNDTISWKFASLDANKNSQLERGEWKAFRKEWKMGAGAQALGIARRKQVRRCWRNVVKFCDEDENKVVSRQEWSECIGLNLLQGSPSSARKGPNPFDHILLS